MRFRSPTLLALLTATGLSGPLMAADVPGLIPYQGRVQVAGQNVTGSADFKFALVDATGTTTYWSNDGTSQSGAEPANAVTLSVTNGQFNLLLGDVTLTNMTAVPVAALAATDVRLKVWVKAPGQQSFTALSAVRLGAAPFALKAATVQDGAIGVAQLAAGAPTSGQVLSFDGNGLVWTTGGAGTPGPAGTPGSVWTSGTTVPTGGADGDFFLKTSTGDVYRRSAGTWSPVANLMGAQGQPGSAGAAGAAGAPGSVWSSGTVVPANTSGADGDFFLKTVSGDVYQKNGGVWGVVANLKGATGSVGATGPVGPAGATGPAGTPGNVWATGANLPPNGSANNGDLFLISTSGEVYQQSSGVWTFVALIKGPQGLPGQAGAQGNPGAPGSVWTSSTGAPTGGVDGDFHLDTVSGDVYRRSSGTWTVVASMRGPANTDTAATADTVALRDSSGDLSAAAFHGDGSLLTGLTTSQITDRTLNNLAGSAAPSADDNQSNGGYTTGSIWIDTSVNPSVVYVNTGEDEGSASWTQLSNDAPPVPPTMVGAGSSSAGQAGLVPAPPAGGDMKVLRGDASWIAPGDLGVQSNGSESYDQLVKRDAHGAIKATAQFLKPQVITQNAVGDLVVDLAPWAGQVLLRANPTIFDEFSAVTRMELRLPDAATMSGRVFHVRPELARYDDGEGYDTVACSWLRSDVAGQKLNGFAFGPDGEYRSIPIPNSGMTLMAADGEWWTVGTNTIPDYSDYRPVVAVQNPNDVYKASAPFETIEWANGFVNLNVDWDNKSSRNSIKVKLNLSGTAVVDTDYALVGGSYVTVLSHDSTSCWLQLNTGYTSFFQLNFMPLADVDATDETLVVEVATDVTYRVDPVHTSQSLTVHGGNWVAPTVSMVAGVGWDGNEGATNGSTPAMQVGASTDPGLPYDVALTYTGDADGSDFGSGIPYSIQVSGLAADILLDPYLDGSTEPDESLTISIVATPNPVYKVGATASQSVTIIDVPAN